MDGGDIRHGPNPQAKCQNELIYNSGGSVQKILYSLPSDASEDEIHDLLLHNHSNLKTSSLCISVFDSLQQKPEDPYRHTMQNTSPTMNWHTKASQPQGTGPRLAAYTTPNLYIGSLVKNWREGSTRGYLTICKMHSTGPWTLNLGS